MNIESKTILVTGANRGIGRALVEEALRRGAHRVYARTRGPLQHSDNRVTPLTLDVTNAAQIQRAVGQSRRPHQTHCSKPWEHTLKLHERRDICAQHASKAQ
jgi:NAD(P)-dependent dehydrogenase (short-subunit alcohol dehydrogenase family)